AYVPTADYVAERLRAKLPKDVEIMAVTGRIPAAERERRVLDLEGASRRVLVATDCLSEGVNLQRLFDAVVHYDLAWNPTREEQLSLFELPDLVAKRDVLHEEWDAAADREKRSRTIFAQQTIDVDEVARELEETRAAIGSATDVGRFVTGALRGAGATVSGDS